MVQLVRKQSLNLEGNALHAKPMTVCDVVIVPTISRMLRAVAAVVIKMNRSVVIVSTLVLRPKAVESFLETSQGSQCA